jgi:hypothetical protein
MNTPRFWIKLIATALIVIGILQVAQEIAQRVDAAWLGLITIGYFVSAGWFIVRFIKSEVK